MNFPTSSSWKIAILGTLCNREPFVGLPIANYFDILEEVKSDRQNWTSSADNYSYLTLPEYINGENFHLLYC